MSPTRKRADLVFTLVLAAVAALALFDSRDWDNRARLFPLGIGSALLVLLGLQLARSLRPSATAGTAVVGLGLVDDAARRRAGGIVGWLLGMAVAIWLLGFIGGGTLVTLAYLRLTARERWPISLALAAGTALFLWAVANVLYVPFPRPGLLDLLGVPV